VVPPDAIFTAVPSANFAGSMVDALDRYLRWTYRLLPETPTDRFMRETVYPNIEKYRKSDANIQIVDVAGQPIGSLPFSVRQTRQDFKFACSSGFSRCPPLRNVGDWNRRLPSPRNELDRSATSSTPL